MPDDSGVEFKHDGIGHLLKDKLFRVPEHQRSYKWEREEHIRQLFNDVQDAMDDQNSDGYFLGMIVLKKGKNEADRLEVIDGQQRLATVSIFFAAVRDYFRSIRDDDRADDIQRIYLAERDTRTQDQEPHLHLNTEDKGFFQKHVIDGAPIPTFKKKDKVPPSHKRLADALAEAKDQVNRIASHGASSSAMDRLMDWCDYFRHKARVVAIFVPEEQNAYTLFETLNDRGLELTKADLIKNHLFGRSGSRLGEVRQQWTEMTATLESAGGEVGTVDFIRHYWSSRHAHVRTKQLYTVVKAKTNAATRAYDIATEMSGDAKLYSALLNPESKVWIDYQSDAMREHVRTLMHVGVSILRPLQLAVMREFERKEIITAFRLFVHWSVRFLVTGGHRSEGTEVPFSEAAIEVSDKKITTGPQLAKKLNKSIPQDDQFVAAFATATVSKAFLARYYLRAIEDNRANSPNPEWIAQPDSDKVNLEHILPLNPSPGWKLTSDEAEPLHARIGNLALLQTAMNTEIKNDTFANKKQAFKNSSFFYTNWIAKQSKWEEAEIDARQTLLAEEAKKTWPLRFW